MPIPKDGLDITGPGIGGLFVTVPPGPGIGAGAAEPGGGGGGGGGA